MTIAQENHQRLHGQSPQCLTSRITGGIKRRSSFLVALLYAVRVHAIVSSYSRYYLKNPIETFSVTIPADIVLHPALLLAAFARLFVHDLTLEMRPEVLH